MLTVTWKILPWALFAAFPGFLPAQAAGSGLSSSRTAHAEKHARARRRRQIGGQATGSPHPVQLDAQHRPITAGGFVSTGPVVFEDDSQKAGLDTWTNKTGTPEKKYIVETKGAGVGLIDYDNDGWMDIYIVNGSTFNALDGKETPPHAALFHNNHDGTFTDVAEKAGVTNDRWGFGVAIADYDNDGWPDIFVSNWGANRLYHNNHDGTFTDVAEKAGVALADPAAWHTGATWGDYDGDGRLDLFVAGYLHYDRNHMPAANSGDAPNAFCTFRGEQVSCGPRGLPGEGDHLFHNNGDGTFTDVSVKAGVSDKPGYYGLGAVFADINNDGKPDLLVGNDSTPNYLYINKGDGTFEDDSYASGFALNEAGLESASMGLAVGDYENNGMLDVFDTAFSDSYKPLYHNDGDGNFTDVSYHVGLGEITVPFLGFGDAFIDYDNDGWKDLLMSNGHVYPQADKYAWGTTWAQRPLLYRNIDGKRFEPVPAVEGTGLADVIAGPRHGRWRLVQRRQDRRRYQRDRWTSGAAAQRESGSQPLAGTEARGRPQKPSRRRGRSRVRHGQRLKAARRRDQRRKLSLQQRSARALRPGRRPQKWMPSKCTGPAAQSSISPCPASIASSP